MRTVLCPGLGGEVSVLGFRCSPLGSRVSEAQSRRLLDYAFERGVTWFDAAPSDGGGQAQAILGRFLEHRRDRVTVAARIGSVQPRPGALGRLFGSVRRALDFFPGVSGLTRRVDREARFARPIRPDDVERSVDAALRRLRTDYLDVLVVQDWDQAGEDPALLDALRGTLARGHVRCLAIAGEPEVVEAARTTGAFRIVQVRSDPFHRAIERVRAAPASGEPEFFVLQEPLHGAYSRLSNLFAGDGGRLAALASQLAYGPPFMTAEILLDYAFGDNPTGVVLAAMSQTTHIEQNCARASRAPRADTVEFVNKTVLASPAARSFARRAP